MSIKNEKLSQILSEHGMEKVNEQISQWDKAECQVQG